LTKFNIKALGFALYNLLEQDKWWNIVEFYLQKKD
jgi:hypothetical protein